MVVLLQCFSGPLLSSGVEESKNRGIYESKIGKDIGQEVCLEISPVV